MNFITAIASAIGFSKLRLALYGGLAVALLASVTFMGAKVYYAGRHAVEMENLRSQTEALIAVTKQDAEAARADAEAARKIAKQKEDILNEVSDSDSTCLDDDILERLQRTIGKEPE